MRESGRFLRTRHSLLIRPAVGLIIVLAMPRSLRPEPADDARSPRDEEGFLPELAPLERSPRAARATQPRERPTATYAPLPFWSRVRMYARPSAWISLIRVRRLYKDVRPFEKMDYLKHYEGEPKEVSAALGVELVDFSSRARRGH